MRAKQFTGILLWIVLLCTAGAIVKPQAQEAGDIVIGYGTYRQAPYIIHTDDNRLEGIFPDFAAELERFSGLKVTFMECPRLRIIPWLKEGRIDLILHSNPSWIEERDSLTWSVPVYRERDILVVRKDSALIPDETQDLQGWKVGTFNGFNYAVLDPVFSSGLAERADVLNLRQNILKLYSGRIDGFVVNEYTHLYYLENDSLYGYFMESPLALSEHDIHFVASAKGRVNKNLLDGFVYEIKKSGKLKTIFDKYACRSCSGVEADIIQ